MVAESEVYVSLVDVRPLPGCEIDCNEVAGAAVRCYVTARSEAEAVARVRESLSLDAFAVVTIHWCVQSTSVEWERPDDRTAATLANEATATGRVVYGEFHSWGHEAPGP